METSASDILNRATREYLHNLIIWGREEHGEPDPRSYDERLNAAKQTLMDSILNIPRDPEKNTEDAIDKVQELLDTAKDVYTAVGMKVGTDMAQQSIQHKRRTREHLNPDTAENDEENDNWQSRIDAFCEGEDFRFEHSNDLFQRMAPRVNLQVLGSHIRDFGQRSLIEKKTYLERLHDAEHTMDKKIDRLTDKTTAEAIREVFNGAQETIADIYFSVGMKAGARLNALLMGDFDKDY